MLSNGAFPAPGRPVVGSNVKGFKAGDIIGFLYITGGLLYARRTSCGIRQLRIDTVGNPSSAWNAGYSARTTTIEKHARTVSGADGFFADYAVIDSQDAVILPETMEIKVSAPIFVRVSPVKR